MPTPIEELTKREMEEGARHTAPKVDPEVAQGDEGPVAPPTPPVPPAPSPAPVENPVPAFLRRVEVDLEDAAKELEGKL